MTADRIRAVTTPPRYFRSILRQIHRIWNMFPPLFPQSPLPRGVLDAAVPSLCGISLIIPIFDKKDSAIQPKSTRKNRQISVIITNGNLRLRIGVSSAAARSCAEEFSYTILSQLIYTPSDFLSRKRHNESAYWNQNKTERRL